MSAKNPSPVTPPPPPPSHPRERQRRAAPKVWPKSGLPEAGNFLGFRCFAYAPVNENGVIFLFGMLAQELGYVVELVGRGFPDCFGRRRVAPGRWSPVRIEFEYRSSNFVAHRHNAAGCDLIVCWDHDWAECRLEVLDLSKEVRKIAAERYWDG